MEKAMARFPKPAEGSWTEHYPQLGTEPVSYEDSISPEFYEIERKAVFKRAWLNVGRVEQLPRKGSYFTKEIKVANTSIIVVRNNEGEVKAYHNICRHRGNKLVWNDMPLEETSGFCKQFTCKYHAWRYDLDGNLTFVQQEEEFFNLDKSRYGLVPVRSEEHTSELQSRRDLVCRLLLEKKKKKKKKQNDDVEREKERR